MNNDIWPKLESRLRSIARSIAAGDNQHTHVACQSTLIKISLLHIDDKLIGWLKPEVIPLEPRGLNLTGLYQPTDNWQQVIATLKEAHGGMLLVQQGEPVGWLQLQSVLMADYQPGQ